MDELPDTNAKPEFELHELVRVARGTHEFYGQAGHIRAIEVPGHPLGNYIVEFAGENMMPRFFENDLEKIVSEPAQNYEELPREDRPEMLEAEDFDPQSSARALIAALFYSDPTRPDEQLTSDDIYVVWFAKTLQNWKCLISTNVKDDYYYEVTFNGDKNEAYVDAYKKRANIVVNMQTLETVTTVVTQEI